MLKRGKNRPAPAVLRAELEAQYGLVKTFGRRPRPRCPFPKCGDAPEPIFCPAHWQLLDGTMRRELLTELRALTSRGQKSASPKMRELFTRAIHEIAEALYAAARKPDEPLVKSA